MAEEDVLKAVEEGAAPFAEALLDALGGIVPGKGIAIGIAGGLLDLFVAKARAYVEGAWNYPLAVIPPPEHLVWEPELKVFYTATALGQKIAGQFPQTFEHAGSPTPSPERQAARQEMNDIRTRINHVLKTEEARAFFQAHLDKQDYAGIYRDYDGYVQASKKIRQATRDNTEVASFLNVFAEAGFEYLAREAQERILKEMKKKLKEAGKRK